LLARQYSCPRTSGQDRKARQRILDNAALSRTALPWDEYNALAFDARLEPVPRAQVHLFTNRPGQHHLAFRRNLRFHGKMILPDCGVSSERIARVNIATIEAFVDTARRI
jgi:hypothetical protein